MALSSTETLTPFGNPEIMTAAEIDQLLDVTIDLFAAVEGGESFDGVQAELNKERIAQLNKSNLNVRFPDHGKLTIVLSTDADSKLKNLEFDLRHGPNDNSKETLEELIIVGFGDGQVGKQTAYSFIGRPQSNGPTAYKRTSEQPKPVEVGNTVLGVIEDLLQRPKQPRTESLQPTKPTRLGRVLSWLRQT